MKRVLMAITLAATLTAPAFADQALATSKNCMACQSEMERHRTRGGVVPRRMIP